MPIPSAYNRTSNEPVALLNKAQIKSIYIELNEKNEYGNLTQDMADSIKNKLLNSGYYKAEQNEVQLLAIANVAIGR